MNVKIIDNWKGIWRYYSMHALAIAAVIPTAWLALDTEFKVKLPDWVPAIIGLLVFIAGVIGRVIKQDEVQ